MMSKNVVQIVQVVNEPTGGGAEFLAGELNRRLCERGFNSCVLYLTNPRSVALGPSEFSLDLSSVRSIFAPFFIHRFFRRFRDRRLLVHAHLTYPLYYLAVMRWPPDAVLVYTEHNTYNRRRSIAALRPVERYIYSRFHGVACISEGCRSSLLAWLGDPAFETRVRTILNGARLFPFVRERPFAQSGLTVVSLGSLTKQKGFDIGLDAVKASEDLVTRYVIIGEGPAKESLVLKADRLGLNTKVHLPGWQDNILPWLVDADVLLIPSLWEGFGLVAIEALSVGLPVIASDVLGLNEVLRGCEAAFLVEPGNAQGMAKAIREYSVKPDSEKLVIAERARARAEAYDLGAMTGRYETFYKEILSERHG